MAHDLYLLDKNATIADALAAITENKRGAIIVVDHDSTLVGVVSDGDIRRALVKGATTMTPVEKITNTNVVSLQSGADQADIDALFNANTSVNLIPRLDEKNRVTTVFARGS